VRRPVVLLLFASLFVGEAMWNAIVPLVPAFAHRFSLSPLEAGLLLASGSVAILIVSAPAGIAADRFGSRRVTLAAMALLVVAQAGQGLAGSFWELLAARTLFGVGFGVVWTAGVAWIGETTGERETEAVSYTVTTAGLGAVAGPAFAGAVVQRLGLAAPFLIAAAMSAVLTAGLALEGSGSGRPSVHERPSARAALATAGREPAVMISLVLMGLGGLIGGVVNLLAPLQLHENGVATSTIGLVFAASAVLFIAASAIVARTGERAARPGIGAAAAATAAAVLVVAIVSTSTPALVAFLLARGAVSAVIFTITFPLGVVGGRAVGAGVGTVAALLNIVWAASALVAPVVAGALAQTVGQSAAYALMAAVSLAVAGWIAAVRPRAPAGHPALGDSGSPSA
jgi:MFS family permease